jgi:hypothetical protein
LNHYPPYEGLTYSCGPTMMPTPRLRGFGCLFRTTGFMTPYDDAHPSFEGFWLSFRTYCLYDGPYDPTTTPTPRLRGFGCQFRPTASMTPATPTPRLRGFGCPFKPIASSCDPYDDVHPSFEGFLLSFRTYCLYDGPYNPHDDAHPSFERFRVSSRV